MMRETHKQQKKTMSRRDDASSMKREERENNSKKKIFTYKQSYSVMLGTLSPYLQFTAVVFVLSILGGFIFPDLFSTFIDYMIAYLREIVSDATMFSLIWTLLSIVLGFTIIYPLFAIALNGYLLGAILMLGIQEQGSLGILLRIIPHGIFELPALLIASAAGLYIGVFWKGDEGFWQRLKLSLRVYVSIVLPLLIIAATIEGILVVFLQ
jgi:stage II sporulation protein M